MARKKPEMIFLGWETDDGWYPAEQYPVSNPPPVFKEAIANGWIKGLLEPRRQKRELEKVTAR